MGGKGSKPPPAPNYSQMSKEQAVLDRNALTNTTYSNRPDQYNPWGSTTWGTEKVIDPATGEEVTKWTQTEKLDPQLQGSLDNQKRLMHHRAYWADSMKGELKGMTAPVDYDQFMKFRGVPGVDEYRQKSEDAAYNRSISRLDPRFEQADQALEVKLRNQGLAPGDEAYDAAMDNYAREKTDAYQTAQDEAVQAGRAESQLGFGQQQSQQAQEANLRQQQIVEFLRQRGQPLDDINALLAGQGIQPASGQSGGFSTAGSQQAPNMIQAAQAQYGAEQDRYSARQAQRQGMMSGMVSLAGAAMMSDRRLKRNIVNIGTWQGYPLYTFEYLWGETAVGVMSDEVNQSAVVRMPNGYDAVIYSKVGV